ncbi:hypothetical protein C8Q74DRAFT_1199706 [Fomes fomentarius]|nr:hypothetical protein C8Q74DRAFT_1199706 [Fomes fomentarius]
MDACETNVKSPGADSLASDVIPSSSPLPSSSPPLVFSSPVQRSPETSPSSSPPSPADLGQVSATPHTEDKDVASVGSHTSLKQSLNAEKPITSVDLSEDLGRRPKRMKSEEPTPNHLPPNPKRPTQASQAKQRKKLAAPFRSPVIKGPLVHGGLHAVYATGRAPPQSSPRKIRADEVEESKVEEAKAKVVVANKDRTANAAKQFKSPLQTPSASVTGVSATSNSASGTFSCIKAAPTIQALQGKVQMLKQAIKIKTSGKEDEDEVLEQLVQKWMAAGREIAWAVWEHVKDLDPGTAPDVGAKSAWFADEDEKVGAKRGFNPNWGYDDEPVAKKARLDECGAGMEVDGEEAADEEDERRVVQHTLGVMLRRLGIDPATLSWDEEEGDFVDA